MSYFLDEIDENFGENETFTFGRSGLLDEDAMISLAETSYNVTIFKESMNNTLQTISINEGFIDKAKELISRFVAWCKKIWQKIWGFLRKKKQETASEGKKRKTLKIPDDGKVINIKKLIEIYTPAFDNIQSGLSDIASDVEKAAGGVSDPKEFIEKLGKGKMSNMFEMYTNAELKGIHAENFSDYMKKIDESLNDKVKANEITVTFDDKKELKEEKIQEYIETNLTKFDLSYAEKRVKSIIETAIKHVNEVKDTLEAKEDATEDEKNSLPILASAIEKFMNIVKDVQEAVVKAQAIMNKIENINERFYS